MAKITIDVPDGQIKRVEDAFAWGYAFDTTRLVEKNEEGVVTKTETKSEFVKRKVVEFLATQVQAYETTAAANEAKKNIAEQVKELKIT